MSWLRDVVGPVGELIGKAGGIPPCAVPTDGTQMSYVAQIYYKIRAESRRLYKWKVKELQESARSFSSDLATSGSKDILIRGILTRLYGDEEMQIFSEQAARVSLGVTIS